MWEVGVDFSVVVAALNVETISYQNQVELLWDGIADAGYYVIKRSVDGLGYEIIGTVPGERNNYVDDSQLYTSQTYSYRVLAYDIDDNLLASEEKGNIQIPWISWGDHYGREGEDEIVSDIGVWEDKGNNATYVFVVGATKRDGSGYDILVLRYRFNTVTEEVQVASASFNGIGNGDDVGVALAIDEETNGGTPQCYVYIAGRTWNGTDYDYVVLKYDADLVSQWTPPPYYNGDGNGDDIPADIAVDKNNHIVYVTGKVSRKEVTGTGFPISGFDYGTISYSSNGNLRWVRFFDGIDPWDCGGIPGGCDENSLDYATAIAVDSNGDVYVTGVGSGDETQGTDPEGDFVTIKYRGSDGTELARVRYDYSSFFDEPHDITVDGWGNVYVTGGSYGGLDMDIVTVSYDSSLSTERWVRRYSGAGNGHDVGQALAVYDSGSTTYVYVVGVALGILSEDYMILCYGADGTLQWQDAFNGKGGGSDIAAAVTVDADGNVYVSGTSGGNCSGYDFTNVKYSSGPIPEWVVRYDGGNFRGEGYNAICDCGERQCFSYEKVVAIAVDSTGNLYAAGLGQNVATSNDLDIVVIRDAFVSKASPQVIISTDKDSYTTNDTLKAGLKVISGGEPIVGDLYVRLSMPNGKVYYYPTWSRKPTPVVRNWNVIDWAVEPFFTYTFSGQELPGTYLWEAALVEPGTNNIIGNISSAPFSFSP